MTVERPRSEEEIKLGRSILKNKMIHRVVSRWKGILLLLVVVRSMSFLASVIIIRTASAQDPVVTSCIKTSCRIPPTLRSQMNGEDGLSTYVT